VRHPRFLLPALIVASLFPLSAMADASAGPTRPSPTSAVVTAGQADPLCYPDRRAPKRQLRAVWIASVVNIDWPSRPGLTPAKQKAELIGWYDDAVARELNAVIVQVRPTADTFWPSALEPWSKYLTGTQGQSPGYDPMRFAVREAHRRNLEFHAWFNPYRVSMDTDRDALVPTHPGRQHPDWVHEYGGKLYYDPGVPEVRALTEDVILEVVRRYDIDAVHFDDYFYPYPVLVNGVELPFPDAETYAQYGQGFDDVEDWRRNNTDLLVSELDQKIHAVKPWVKFGVSPFAVWRNIATDPEGSDTTAGAQTYDDLYADTRTWVREEWLDYVAPQVYWNIGFAPADYAKLVPWWSDQVRGTNVQLYIGQATYKVEISTQDPAWQQPREMSRHLAFNRNYPQVRGDIYFSAKDVRANRLGHMDIVQAEHYARPALIPVTADVPGRAPRPPNNVTARRTTAGVTVSWNGPGTSFAIYRYEGTQRPDRCDFSDATHLLATVHRAGSRQIWVDGSAPAGKLTYYVSALDRAYREGTPTGPAPVR